MLLDRKTLIKLFIGNNDNNITDQDLEKLGNLTEGYSQGEIYDIINKTIKFKNSHITFENMFLYHLFFLYPFYLDYNYYINNDIFSFH